MHEARELKNHESTLLSGAMLSIVGHCLAAALLVQVASTQPVATEPRAIMVDIRNPSRAGTPSPAPVLRPDRKAAEQSVQKQLTPPMGERMPVTQPAQSEDQPAISAAAPPDAGPDRTKALPLSTHHLEPAGEGPPHDAPSKGRGEPVVNVRANSAAAAYLARIRVQIERNKDYPVAARRGRLQGAVRIRCVLAGSGAVMLAAVSRSSGHEILDRAALNAVKGAGPFPEAPAGIRGDRFEFELPVVFRLAETDQ